MEFFEDSAKEKHWADFKSAVGTMVIQQKEGVRMNLDELLLNIKAVGFDSLVCQKDILTEEDKERYRHKGYWISLTVDEFKARFEVDPGCVWYTPSIAQDSLYFNPKTLAAANFPVGHLLYDFPTIEQTQETWVDKFYRNIQEIEREVAGHDYMHAIMALPDAMQMEYFNKLVEKKGVDVPGLYELFFSFYTNSDYGFQGIKRETLGAILGAKTDEDVARTYRVLAQLPEVVKIYRGGNSASTPYEEALSWTLDVNVANFFACRRGKDEGYVVEAEVSKKDIIDAFLDDRSEQEVIVDPSCVRVSQDRKIHGVEFLHETLPKVMSMYHGYRDKLMKLEFAQDSDCHEYGHEARVMLLSLLIGAHEGLSLRDREILASAAIYHDLRRVNDGDDEQHGKDARDFYHRTATAPSPLVEFLCEYHCRPDEEGYKEIKNNRKLRTDKRRAKLLIDIFKDADALDRCRFGLRDLDVNQLRLDISKELPLVARLCFEQIKVPERKRRPKLDDAISFAKSVQEKASLSGEKTSRTDRDVL